MIKPILLLALVACLVMSPALAARKRTSSRIYYPKGYTAPKRVYVKGHKRRGKYVGGYQRARPTVPTTRKPRTRKP